MLEKLDLSKKLTKTEYKEAMDQLEIQAGHLQREAQRLGIPIIILLEGWDAAGKGTMINRLALSLDSRGFNVHPIMPLKGGSRSSTGAGADGCWRTASTRR